jgi:hypothetical protein
MGRNLDPSALAWRNSYLLLPAGAGQDAIATAETPLLIELHRLMSGCRDRPPEVGLLRLPYVLLSPSPLDEELMEEMLLGSAVDDEALQRLRDMCSLNRLLTDPEGCVEETADFLLNEILRYPRVCRELAHRLFDSDPPWASALLQEAMIGLEGGGLPELDPTDPPGIPLQGLYQLSWQWMEDGDWAPCFGDPPLHTWGTLHAARELAAEMEQRLQERGMSWGERYLAALAASGLKDAPGHLQDRWNTLLTRGEGLTVAREVVFCYLPALLCLESYYELLPGWTIERVVELHALSEEYGISVPDELSYGKFLVWVEKNVPPYSDDWDLYFYRPLVSSLLQRIRRRPSPVAKAVGPNAVPALVEPGVTTTAERSATLNAALGELVGLLSSVHARVDAGIEAIQGRLDGLVDNVLDIRASVDRLLGELEGPALQAWHERELEGLRGQLAERLTEAWDRLDGQTREGLTLAAFFLKRYSWLPGAPKVIVFLLGVALERELGRTLTRLQRQSVPASRSGLRQKWDELKRLLASSASPRATERVLLACEEDVLRLIRIRNKANHGSPVHLEDARWAMHVLVDKGREGVLALLVSTRWA